MHAWFCRYARYAIMFCHFKIIRFHQLDWYCELATVKRFESWRFVSVSSLPERVWIFVESLHGGQFTLSTQLIKPSYRVILPPFAAPQFLLIETYPLCSSVILTLLGYKPIKCSIHSQCSDDQGEAQLEPVVYSVQSIQASFWYLHFLHYLPD